MYDNIWIERPNWTGLLRREETVNWAEAYDHTEKNYEALRSFTE